MNKELTKEYYIAELISINRLIAYHEQDAISFIQYRRAIAATLEELAKIEQQEIELSAAKSKNEKRWDNDET